MNETNGLPDKWLRVKLSEIGSLVRGVSYSKHEAADIHKIGYLPILRANNINQELNFDKLVYVPQERVSDEQRISVLDIIIAMSSGSKDLVGKAAQARHDYEGGFGAFCGLVRVTKEISGKFVGYFFQSPEYKDKIAKLSSGVNINNLRREHIELFDIPLPPLPEQQRIVAKIEELFTKLDAGVDALKKARVQLRRYRQSVLKSAVTGELTRGWREAHKGEFEPAADLLARILRERRAKWEADQLAKMQAAGKRPKNDDWKQKYQEPAAPDTSELPELPLTWCWASLASITDAVGGYAFKSENFGESGKHQVIKMANIKMGKIDLSQRAAFLNDVETDILERYGLRQGDVLVTLTGTRKKRDYGFIVALKAQRNSLLLNQRIARLRPSHLVLSSYLEIAMQSETYQDRFFSYETGNVGQGNVGMAAITVESIVLTPLVEQQLIVSEVERLLSIADAMEQTIEQSLKQAERLRQSILQQAFAGKLVPQNPADEPAESLLARIKAERAQNGNSSRKPRRPTRKQKQPVQPNMLP